MFWFNERSSSISSICCAVCHRIHLRMLILFCLFLSKKKRLVIFVYKRHLISFFFPFFYFFNAFISRVFWKFVDDRRTFEDRENFKCVLCTLTASSSSSSSAPFIHPSSRRTVAIAQRGDATSSVSCALLLFVKPAFFSIPTICWAPRWSSTGATASQRPAFASELS